MRSVSAVVVSRQGVRRGLQRRLLVGVNGSGLWVSLWLDVYR
jgi:hypothetical protein